ncbi:hypothetical protein HX823_19050 [Pseudomonas sp. P7759]|uniref:hypothetical protein n=1 Tax=Pseudomonas sp. P7759 TaxID=2738831 RepID=UPI0015A24B3D|nr:hypothetical protein [Pseudomonas sp. P7759]NWC76179.1 hypothetical protein [Pseudomonas sp. P7759]
MKSIFSTLTALAFLTSPCFASDQSNHQSLNAGLTDTAILYQLAQATDSIHHSLIKDQQNEKIQRTIGSIGFVDMDAQSRYFLDSEKALNLNQNNKYALTVDNKY